MRMVIPLQAQTFKPAFTTEDTEKGENKVKNSFPRRTRSDTKKILNHEAENLLLSKTSNTKGMSIFRKVKAIEG
jgi:hypothetical protein